MSTKVTTLQSVQNILGASFDTTESMIGRDITIRITRVSDAQPVLNANKEHVQAADGSGPLYRRIANTNYLSHVAKRNQRNLDTLAKGRKAEAEGDYDTAEKEYQQLRNKVQLTFNVLSTKKLFDELHAGDVVIGTLVEKSTEKGSFLTVTNVVKQAPMVGKQSDTSWLTAIPEEPSSEPEDGFNIGGDDANG